MNVANLRHVHRMAAAVIVMAFIVLIGWAPEQVFAQSIGAGIPYDQSWKNDSGKTVDNTFSYLLEAEDSKSPMPSEGGSFKLTGNDKGTIDLTFTFWKPGYYHYKVTPQTTKKDEHYTCDKTVYHITLMVVNGSNGLELMSVTIRDDKDAKYSALEYRNSYHVEPKPTKPTNPTKEPAPTRATGSSNGGGGSPGGGAAKAGAAAQGTTEEQPDMYEWPESEDLEEDDGIDIPIQHEEEPDYWALLNLILMILTVLICLADIILYFRRESDKEDRDIPKRKRRKLPLRIATIAPAVIAVIMFFLTEDMDLEMEWVDEWTIWMVIWLILAALMALMTRTKKSEDETNADSQ